jgi:ribosomal protein L7/L12
MSADYTLILRSCPEGHRESAAAFIGKAFSLKEHTCQQIVGSAPIVLLAGLGREEAAAMHLMVHGLQSLGAKIELSAAPVAELPKIDWPRRPQVFKRELSEWVADLQIPVPVAGGATPIIELLLAALEGRPATRSEFTGSALPEVTPAGGSSLPEAPQVARPMTVRTPVPPPTTLPPPPQPTGSGNGDDTLSRLNELFPEEDGGFLPKKDEITNILNRLLPDEADGGAANTTPSKVQAVAGSGGYSVFLAKINDDERRQKAVPIIAELGKLGNDEAEALSKKMIIQVLKGATKEDAEAAKNRFGKIGILARIKGPE